MKIAILADFPLRLLTALQASTSPGGHTRSWLVSVYKAFARIPELEVHWIVLTGEVEQPVETVQDGQYFYVIPAAPSRRAATLYRKDRRAIQQRLDAIRPDLVHGWGTEDVYGWAAVSSGYPNIVSMQGILSYYVLRNRMNPREYFQALLELYVFFKAGFITTESAWGKRTILRRNPRAHVEIVEYGVQDHFLDIQWQPDPQKPVVIFIGALCPRKGIQDLVAAFRSETLRHAELWVVGAGGAWADKLRENAPSNIRWMGRCSPDETARLLSRAWCLALPTRADTSPNVVKEARVIGMPVVSTPCGGQETYIQDGENGFLVEPGDIVLLTGCMSEILNDFERCKKLGAYNHEKHRELLDPKETAKNFYRLYKEQSNR